MSLILTPDKFRKQPQFPAQIDWSNPQAQGLLAAWYFGVDGMRDTVAGRTGVITGGALGKSIDSRGVNPSFNNTQYATISNIAGIQPTNFITVSHWVKQSASNANFKNTVSKLTNGAANDYGFFFASATSQLYGGVDNVNAGPSPSALPIGVWWHVAVTYDGSHVNLYINGVLTNTTAKTGVITYSANSLYFNNNASGGSEGYISLSDVRIYSVAKTAKQIADIYSNPWQLFKAPPRKWWVVSGTAVTIDSIYMSDWQSRFLNDRQIQTDFIAPQVIDKIIGPEWGMGVLKDSTISSEILATTSRDSRSNSDWISSLMMDKQIALDSATSLLADERMVLESLSLMQKDSVFSVDHLANLLTDYPVPVEWSGSIQVITDSIAPIEWAAQLRADSVVPIEWQGGLQIHMDASVPMDWAAQVQADFQIPNEHVVAFLTDKQVTLDFASSVAASQNLSNCWMMIRHFDSSVPAEWQGLTSPFDIGVTHIFRVDSRGTVFAISPRDEDFSIAPRSTIFNIIN